MGARDGASTARFDFDALAQGRCGDPFAVLGLTRPDAGDLFACVHAPDAEAVTLVDAADPQRAWSLGRLHPGGVFGGRIKGRRKRFAYRLERHRAGETTTTDDPYRFGPVLPHDDLVAFAQGRLERPDDLLGAHPMIHEGASGVRFAVWAPHASRVSVVGDFNVWDGRRLPMRKRHEAGVWELFVPDLEPGAVYKYELLDASGALLPLKADPFARAAEMRPATASRVVASFQRPHTDHAAREARARRLAVDAPVSIYEVHLGSWRRGPDGRFLTYAEAAESLIPYVRELGFTHVQFMPLSEHPFDGSWGYQPVGLYAATARHGTPQDLADMIARFHEAGIGVLMDFVPAHFPMDPHGLGRFDGTALFEHPDPQRGYHPDWKTWIYDFGRPEVSSFLTGAALAWLERFDVDGLRVDAVSSMLYLDYSRGPGEWTPNVHGGNENLEAIGLLRRITEAAARRAPHAAMIAEESTAWPGVTRPSTEGGLGFAYKWNLGWMHDTLEYLKKDPIHRRWSHDKMTFPIVYGFAESWILPLSHDEVVHGKGSLLAKMPGDRAAQLATLRAYYAFMWAHPGKKLLFMGGEFAQPEEWSHDGALRWDVAAEPAHDGVRRLIGDLNRVLAAEPALHERDRHPDGFAWVQADAAELSVFAFLRWDAARRRPVLAVSNFTPVRREDYRVGVPHGGRWRLLIDTDHGAYAGGGGMGAAEVWAEETPWDGQPYALTISAPGLSTLLFAGD